MQPAVPSSAVLTAASPAPASCLACAVAVGCRADELFGIIQSLPFEKLARPELGALMRAGGNLLLTGLRRLYGRQVKRSSSLFRQVAPSRYIASHRAPSRYAAVSQGRVVRDRPAAVPPPSHRRFAAVTPPLRASVLSPQVAMLSRGTGPGLNSGLVLDEMLGSALANKTGDPDITLGDVQRRFGKRLVIIVTELTSGKERQLTPETHAELPLRLAVRMSMGVPGLMEPVRYNGHLYCDGGVTNDFPMHVLPETGRIGLMVKPKQVAPSRYATSYTTVTSSLHRSSRSRPAVTSHHIGRQVVTPPFHRRYTAVTRP